MNNQKTFNYIASFILRQLYRVFLVYPYFAITWFWYSVLDMLTGKSKVGQVPYCFLITSVIFPKMEKRLSYNEFRSVFSPEERARHTIETINSIRSKVPDAKIILLEGGLEELLPLNLANLADQYIYMGNKRLVRFGCDSRNKGVGEAMMLLVALGKLKWQPEYYFKISGRYSLTDDFNLASWRLSDKITVLPLKDDYFCTRLYGIPASKLNKWRSALIKGLPFNVINYPIENTLSKFVARNDLEFKNKIGLRGIAASVKGDIVIED